MKKGMLEKARQGVFPAHAPFGYRNDKATRTIEVDPVDSPMFIPMMEAYAKREAQNALSALIAGTATQSAECAAA